MSSLNVVPTPAAGFVFSTNTFGATGPFSGVNTYAPGQGCAQWRFDFWGEQLQVRMISGAGANPLTVQIDGGSLTTPTIASGVMGYYNLATGLSLGWHTVVVRTQATATALHLSQTDGFRVTASDNNPQVRLSTGYKTWLPLGATALLSDGKFDLPIQFGFSASQRVGGGFRADRFRAKTDKLPVFVVVGGTSYVQLRVDGTVVGTPTTISNPATSGGYFDFVDIAALVGATLDASAFHEYEVEWSTVAPSTHAYVGGYALSLATGAQDTTATYTPRARDAYIGDSIVAGYNLSTPFKSWPYLASRARGGIAVTSALSASREEVDGPTLASALATWAPYAFIWNEYGTNDMSHHGTSTPASAWATADITTLENLLDVDTSAHILRLGILPRSAYDATVRGNWNGLGANGMQANMAATTEPERLHYIDPLTVGLVDPTDYLEVSPTERLHPDDSGSVKLAAVAVAAMDVPDDPTSVSVIAGTHTTLTLGWAAPSGGGVYDGYEVRLNAGSWVPIGDVLSYEFTGLTPSTPYSLAVRTAGPAGTSTGVTVADSTDEAPIGTFTLVGNLTELTAEPCTRVPVVYIGVTHAISQDGVSYPLETPVPVENGSFSVLLPTAAEPAGYEFTVRVPLLNIVCTVPVGAVDSTVYLGT